MGETVATTSSRALLAACDRIGLASSSLLATAGLSAAQVNDPEGRLPVEAVAALWTAALQQSGDPGLGLHVALAVPFGAYRIIDFLAASSATVGEALARVARYFPLVNSSLGWVITSEPPSMRVTLTSQAPGRLPRLYAEYVVAVTVVHCRRASGFEWPIEEVRFAFEEPPNAAEHLRAFGCPVRFGQPYNELVIGRATWDLPCQAPSSDLVRALEDHADRMIGSQRADRVISAQVARHIADELQGGEVVLGKIARKMAMSARTLQRRLEGEGTSFADVLDETRRYIAEAYIKEPELALTEISYLLGFSEPSAFTRAFNRWFGVAPSQFRQRQPQL